VTAPVPKDAEGTTPYVKWSVKADPVTNEFHGPLVVRDLVVVGNDAGELRAYRVGDGQLAWRHDHGKRIYDRPCSDGERVYFTSDDGLTAVTVADGKKVWDHTVLHGAGPSAVLPDRGLVFVGGHDGTLYTLEAKTGRHLRSTDFLTDAPPDRPRFPGNKARGRPEPARPSALSTDGVTVFLTVFDQSRVVAVNAATGKTAWSFQADGWISGEVATTDTQAFVGSQDGHLYCLDKRTGNPVWKFKTKSRVESGAVVDGQSVYVCSCDGSLYGVNRSDGTQRWRFDTDRSPDGRGAIYSTPVLRRGGLHFAAGEGQVYAVDAESGAARWKLRPVETSDLYCSPAFGGGCYFVTSRPRTKGQGESVLAAIGLK
jgi:outer membrane protein assembly factor BamB